VKVVGRTSGSSTYVNYDAVRIESLSQDGKGVAASALPKA
jgi:hypothetical protein